MQADDFGRSHEMNAAIDYAIRQGLVCSTALLMGSEFTQEAIEMADRGGYLQNVHCHLNLDGCRSVGNHFVPLNENYKKSRFCKDGEFSTYSYYKADYYKYSDVILEELETQYLRFKELTNDQANYEHLDFHCYGNYSPPVSKAYRDLIRKYGVKTARFFGEHDRFCRLPSRKRSMVRRAVFFFAERNRACVVKSSKIEYFLMHPELFKDESVVELYVHPEYREGLLIDKTNSLIGADYKPLEEHIRLVKETGNTEFFSWEDFCR